MEMTLSSSYQKIRWYVFLFNLFVFQNFLLPMINPMQFYLFIQGSEIHCTCKRVFLDRVKKLQVGQWKFLENFSVYPATGMYRPTSHLYKMSITANSIVTNSTPNTCKVSSLLFLNFINILMRLLKPKRLIRSQIRLIDQHKESSSEDISMENTNEDQLCEGYPTYAQFVVLVLFHVGFGISSVFMIFAWSFSTFPLNHVF